MRDEEHLALVTEIICCDINWRYADVWENVKWSLFVEKIRGILDRRLSGNYYINTSARPIPKSPPYFNADKIRIARDELMAVRWSNFRDDYLLLQNLHYAFNMLLEGKTRTMWDDD